MATLNFPNPNINQTYTENGKTGIWDENSGSWISAPFATPNIWWI